MNLCLMNANLMGINLRVRVQDLPSLLRFLPLPLLQSLALAAAILYAPCLAQNRPRLYIIGQKKSCMSEGFQFPPAEAPTKLAAIVDKPLVDKGALPKSSTGRRNLQKAIRKWKKRDVDVNKSWVVVDVMASKSRSSSMHRCLPCLTAARAAAGGHWITCLRRMLRPAELLRAQGFDPKAVRWHGILTQRQLGAAVGNSMTQTTLAAVLRRLLPSVGLA